MGCAADHGCQVGLGGRGSLAEESAPFGGRFSAFGLNPELGWGILSVYVSGKKSTGKAHHQDRCFSPAVWLPLSECPHYRSTLCSSSSCRMPSLYGRLVCAVSLPGQISAVPWRHFFAPLHLPHRVLSSPRLSPALYPVPKGRPQSFACPRAWARLDRPWPLRSCQRNSGGLLRWMQPRTRGLRRRVVGLLRDRASPVGCGVQPRSLRVSCGSSGRKTSTAGGEQPPWRNVVMFYMLRRRKCLQKNTTTPPRISSSHLHHKTAMASVFSTATAAHSSHTTAPLHQGFAPRHPVQSNHRHIVRPPQHNHPHPLTHHRSADAAKYIKKYKYIEAVCLLWHPHPSCSPDPSC